jgi:hypothetical protein
MNYLRALIDRPRSTQLIGEVLHAYIIMIAYRHNGFDSRLPMASVSLTAGE